MSRAAEFIGSRRVPHVAVLALIAFGVAGCSGDVSTRFSQSSLSNPFGYQADATGSVPAQPAQTVERHDLPQYARPQSTYQSSALPPAVTAPQSYPKARARRVAQAGIEIVNAVGRRRQIYSLVA